MSSNKRVHPSGAQKRKMLLESEAAVKKLKPITSFFTPQHQEQKKQKSEDEGQRESYSSSSDMQQKEIEADIIVTTPNTDSNVSIATDESKKEDMEAPMLNPTMEHTNLLEKRHPADKGHYKSVLTAELKRFIISHGPCQPMGPFPRDEQTGNRFSSFFYESKNKAGLKIPRTWLCYSEVLDCAYYEVCWLFADRECASYQPAWVDGFRNGIKNR